MENRIKEQQLFLFADRTSSHMFRANEHRLWFSAIAYLILCQHRRVGLAGTDHARPQSSTIRVHLLKVAAAVIVSNQRILVRLPRSFPFWELWRQATSALATT